VRRTLLAVCVPLAAAVIAPMAAAAQGLPNHERHVMSVGHADVLNITSHVDHFHVEVEDDSGDAPVTRKLTDVLLHAKPESRIDVPDLPAYGFLGQPGEPVWILPEIQNDELLWPGWNTEDVLASEFPDAHLKLRLLSVIGPAQVSVFTSDPVGNPQMIFDSANALPQTAEILNRTHTHVNWAFEAEGLYSMMVQVEGRLADGRTITSRAHEMRWFVGDLAALPQGAPTTSLSIGGLADQYAVGDTVTLSADYPRETGLTDARWTRTCADGTNAALGTGATVTFIAAVEHDACRVSATLSAADGTVVAVAPDVTLRVVAAPAPAQGTPSPPPAGPGAVAPSVPTTVRPVPPRELALVRSGDLRVSSLIERGRDAVLCRLAAAGRCTVRLTVSAAAARKLGLRIESGATRYVVATGERRASRAGAVKVTVRLTRSARRALRRTARVPAIRIDATATLADGTRRTGRASLPASRVR